MPRFCGHCGYDVTGAQVQPEGRLCTECGRVGRGVRLSRSLGWVVRRTAAPFVVLFGVAWGLAASAMLAAGATGDSFPGGILALAAVAVGAWAVVLGIVQAVTLPWRWAKMSPGGGGAGWGGGGGGAWSAAALAVALDIAVASIGAASLLGLAALLFAAG